MSNFLGGGHKKGIVTKNMCDLKKMLIVFLYLNITNNAIANNSSAYGLFFNSAHAKLSANDYIKCAVVAIGADILWGLGESSASTCGKAAMKKAFATVAKRMLGPIGVAIAVVSFGICITEANYDN